VSAAEVRKLEQSSETVLVDARDHIQYQQGHIPGAVSLPVYDLDEYLFPFLENHLPSTSLVVYCSNPDCRDSHLLAEELAAAGYGDIRIFAGGMAAWQEKGYDVEADH
ncbi:MAG: rhodanese-like domain-containing protein, partial [Desulfosudaceae bacterium]